MKVEGHLHNHILPFFDRTPLARFGPADFCQRPTHGVFHAPSKRSSRWPRCVTWPPPFVKKGFAWGTRWRPSAIPRPCPLSKAHG